MFVPKPLQKGDKVALIAPAGRIQQNLVEKAKNAVEKLGYVPILGDSCYAAYGYFAGNDELRARDVQQSFEDESIAAIFCMRGGFGSSKLLPLLDYEKIRQHPKIFTGYSDITALHSVFNERCDFVTYLAPMPSIEFVNPSIDDYTLTSFKKAMTTAHWTGRELTNPPQLQVEALVGGVATGRLTGGNLTLLASSLGTPYEIDTKNKILFIEEIDESPRQIDRLFTQLEHAGKLRDAAGFILGSWTNCKPFDAQTSFTVKEVWQHFLAPLQKPTVTNVACGHSLPMMTMPLGLTVRLDADAKTITVQ